tara:strand:- start:514 stop:1101 length:588 start_codon:yes stop_codon:yes gene_type:complete
MKLVYKNKAKEILQEILQVKTKSLPGGLPYLLFGEGKVSTQSLFIKIGRNFEKWFKFIVEDAGMTLLPDGVVKNVIGKKSKDIDLIFRDDDTIYYREMKSNLELDTEKLPATYEKIQLITKYVEKEYPGYKVDSSLLHWSVYEPSILPTKYNTKVKECGKHGVKVSYPIDLFKTISVDISDKEYYNFFRELGGMC